MTPPPVALSLMICEQVIVDLHTQNPTPVSIFTGLSVEEFPSPPQRFSIFACLTNGRGEHDLRLVANRLDTGESFYEQRHRIHFPNPLLLSNVHIRVRGDICFPESGRYEFVLYVDSDPVAQRSLRVY